jgi:hypothetical protein
MVNKLIKSEQERFYAAMGRFVIAWTDMEFCLDLVVLNGRKLKSPLPHQLSEKTNFVRKVLVPVLSPIHATSVLRLIDEIDELAPTRHDYVHGAVIGHDIVRSKLTMSLTRMLQPSKKPRRKIVKVTTAELLAIARRLREIADDLLDLAEAILHEERPCPN